jgi:predicted dehydrogenase
MATPRIRYAVVGLGHIAQVAVLPAFEHARGHCELTALVSDEPDKLSTLARRYHVPRTYSYEQYGECLQQVDAVYLALPNHLHATYAVLAARSGVHVLCEKPMAVTVDECESMVQAAREHDVKLMIAYRLHFERTNLQAAELATDGSIGEPKLFNSTFTMRVDPENIRAKRATGGGTLYDIGVYCINAARYLFKAEPKEVMACAVNGDPLRLPEIEESVAAILRFEPERVASFVVSFNASDVGWYEIVGTKGSLRVDPAYEYAEGNAYELTIEGKKTKKEFPKRDQFAAELIYFSECIINNTQPEPSGEEGLQDVRIIRALYESAETGKPVEIPPYVPAERPTLDQDIQRPPVEKPPKPVKARSPHANQ